MIANRPELPQMVNNIIQYCKERDISNTVEILKKCQQEIVLGRSLDIEGPDTRIDGQTTFNTLNQDNVLVTSLEEISGLTPHELRHTLQVQFYNEVPLYLIYRNTIKNP
ncbi:hypothetical protein DPMN_146983 [Dreissena polymorpha]|uniref:Uncharacterized protein n=1 Tax=Dreissena polymorpha TaxID=45954 RepID=A0A9D4FCU4_DREPO|nr:hypothetical protein DPMN_146983 [Dreissena polymorpha]